MKTKYVIQHIPTSGFQMAGLKVMTNQNFGISLEQITVLTQKLHILLLRYCLLKIKLIDSSWTQTSISYQKARTWTDKKWNWSWRLCTILKNLALMTVSLMLLLELFLGIFFIVFYLLSLFVTEREAMKHCLIASWMKRACVSNVDCSSMNGNVNGRVVHITQTWKITSDETARDPELNFILDSKAVVLKGNIEILHWQEKETTEDKSTMYTYELIWTKKDIDSRDFQEAGHANTPSSVMLHSKTFYGAASVSTYSLFLHVLR